MTMLDRMRRHKSWLKWSLFIVVATFILLYVPQFLSQDTGRAPNDVLATVEGHDVRRGVYDRVYNQQVAQMRASYSGDLSEQMLRQLGIGQRIVDQLIDQEAIVAEAERLGITVSDGELRERLIRTPSFQQNGEFIGWDRYVQILDSARPPVRPAEFEDEFRRSLLREKLEATVTGWMTASDAEVEREYRRRNEKVKLEVAAFASTQLRAGIQPTDAEISAQFTANQDKYKVPEKRRVRFLSIDAQSLRAKMAVTPQEVETRYRDNAQTYATPEQVRASHILFKTEGKDDAAVKKLAESVLAKVKAGGDFAVLAKQFSDDDSKSSGGDLDYFSKGTMVKEFEEAAWSLKPGEVSGLVKSQFGYHIIKVADHRAATNKTLDQVRTQIEDAIRFEKAQAEATKVADDLAKQIKAPADLDTVAKARGLTVGDSGLFARDEPIAGLGFADAVTSEAFTLDLNKVSGALKTTQGVAFIALTEVKPAHAAALDEVKDKVREDVTQAKATALAATKAAALSKAVRGGANFEAAAKTAGVDVKSTDFITRGSAIPNVGTSEKVDTVAFALKAGETSEPIATDSAVVVVRVKERQDITPEVLNAEHDSIRDQLLQQRRNEFFTAYITKAKKKMKILYNESAMKAIMS